MNECAFDTIIEVFPAGRLNSLDLQRNVWLRKEVPLEKQEETLEPRLQMLENLQTACAASKNFADEPEPEEPVRGVQSPCDWIV